MGEPVRGDSIDMPEQVQLENPVEAGERGKPGVGKLAVDQQPRSLMVGGFEQRKVVQERNAGVSNEPSCAESAELPLALERFDSAVTGRRAHQVDLLQAVAEAE